MTMMTTNGSNRKRSGGTRTRFNKSVPTPTIPRTAVTVMTQATRTRIHDLQSGRSFALDVLAVLRRQMKPVTAVKAPDPLNDASHLLLKAILHQSITLQRSHKRVTAPVQTQLEQPSSILHSDHYQSKMDPNPISAGIEESMLNASAE